MNQLHEMDQTNERSGVMQLWEKLWWSKWTIVLVTLAFLLFGIIYNFLSQPIYSADTVLQVGQQEDASTGAELGDDLTLSGSANPLTAELQIIRSRTVLGTTIDEFNLDMEAKPKYYPVIGEAIARWRKPGLFGEKSTELPSSGLYRFLSSFRTLNLDDHAWGGESIRVKSFTLPDVFYNRTFVLTTLPNASFDLKDQNGNLVLSGQVGKLSTVESGTFQDTSILVAGIESRIGGQFEIKRTNRTETINELQDNLRISELGDESGIVKIELRGNDPKTTESVLNAITEAYLQRSTTQKVAAVQKNLEFLEQRLPIVKSDLSRFEAELNQFRLDRGSIDLDLETQNTVNRIVTIEAEIRDLDLKRNDLRSKYTARHPSVASLDSQKVLLSQELRTLQGQVNEMPQIQQRFLSLTRNVDINTALYTALLSRSEELKIAKASVTNNITVLDGATAAAEPVAPKKLAVLAIATLIGALLGALYSLVKSSLVQGVEDPNEIEKQLGLPVLATIPQSRAQLRISKRDTFSQSDVQALSHLQPYDVAVESLRSLRTTLLFRGKNAKNNIVLITSASPQAGKSFVSLNLSILLANSGNSVVLVDADMRRGHLHKSFLVKQDPGLSNSIGEGLLLDDVIQKTEIDGLSFVARGNPPPNPSDLLFTTRFLALLKNLSLRFDHVIIDSPPVLAAADAGIIGNSAGRTLLVVKSGVNPLREIAQCKKQLAQNSVEIKGVIVNDIAMTGKSKSYGGYVYQYAQTDS